MAGMPAWAQALRGIQFAGEMANTGMGLYESYAKIRDRLNDERDAASAQKIIGQVTEDPNSPVDLSQLSNPVAAKMTADVLPFAQAQGYTKQATPTIKALSDYAKQGWGSDPNFTAQEWTQGLMQTMGTPYDPTNPIARKSVQDFQNNANTAATPESLRRLYSGAASPTDMANIATSPVDLKNLAEANTQYRWGTEQQRKDTDADNLAQFQSAIAGLSGKSTSPFDLRQYAKNGGYAPISSIEKDIRQAASDYGVGNSDEVNKAITQAREGYSKTYLPQETVQVGRTTATGQRNLLGDFRKDVSSTAPNVNVSVNAASPNDIDTLARMVANGEMAPSQLPKRQGLYNQVVAKAKQLNPQFNPRTADTNFSVGKNPQFVQRANTAEALPEVMQNMVETGKKVNYPDAKFAGVAKKWVLGQINDPTLTEYMSQRNDALMTIAGVMRANGMTDMAHKAETEAASPTMSPRALDAWYRGQMKSLEPRLKMNREIRGTVPNVAPTGKVGKYTYTVR